MRKKHLLCRLSALLLLVALTACRAPTAAPTETAVTEPAEQPTEAPTEPFTELPTEAPTEPEYPLGDGYRYPLDFTGFVIYRYFPDGKF